MQQGGGGKEKDSGEEYDDGTGKQETKRNRGITGKQRRSWGEVPFGGDRPGGEQDEIIEWSGEEMEGYETEEEAETEGGGRGGVSKTRTATPRVSTGSGAGNSPEGATAGRGDTWVVTSVAGDEAGEGGHHEERPGERERVSVLQENPSGESSGVGVREGVCEAS